MLINGGLTLLQTMYILEIQFLISKDRSASPVAVTQRFFVKKMSLKISAPVSFLIKLQITSAKIGLVSIVKLCKAFETFVSK